MTPQEPPDLAQPDDTMAAIASVSLRLMAGAVPRSTLESLKRTLVQSPAEFPWRVVTQAVLAVPVEEQKLVQQGLRAQRDWILRGGRENPGKPLSVRAKTLAARLLTQLIFLTVYSGVVLVLLLALKHKWPGADVYRLLGSLYEVFPGLAPR
jgi:hypothetical protein